jgi:putative membrane-bound dehydrogenase-like protein
MSRLRLVVLLAAAGAIACSAGVSPAQDAAPLRVFIRAGKKTHGPGEHDHPRFLEDWKVLLAQRGARVDGALEFPTEAQLAAADVLVLYAAEGGTMNEAERDRLDAFTKRGGGIAVLHDAVCGTDPHWFKTVVGGAWEHGKSKWFHGQVGIYVQDYEHPITKGVANFFMDDEIYWDLHLAPEARVIATGFRTEKEVTPQMWVYEKGDYRAFVNIQGHRHASFSLPHYRAILLRGIAWAAKRDVDLLVTKDEIASLRYPPGGPLRPDKAHEPFQLQAGFDAGLVVAEPHIAKPISLDFDARGRLWLALTPQYPNKARIGNKQPGDKIAIVDLDRAKYFYEKLDLVTSLAFHKDGVIVTQAPDILWLRDTDGDDVADKVETLFTGFGFGDTHAVMSNLRWGMDGWLYATQGYSGNGSNHVTNAAGRDFGKIGNGLFRFRPDGSAIEMVSSYGSNTWGCDFSWDGELFFTMANGSHLRHVVMTDAALSRGKVGLKEGWKDVTDHRKSVPALKYDIVPYKQIDNTGGFTASAGSVVYAGGAWPEEFENTHFHTECTVNLIHHDLLRSNGVTFTASKPREEEFLAATDLWFRPVDLRVGPDGALYVADFYNLAAVHNDTRGPRHGPYNAAVRPDRDHLHGRVWRIQHREARALPAAKFDSPSNLAAALEHPNRWQRMTAHRLLVERREGAAEVAAILASTKHAYAKVHALWILHQLGGLSPEQGAAALDDPSAGVRKTAARLAALIGRSEALRDKLVAKLPSETDPRARLEMIQALAAFPVSPAVASLITKHWPDTADNYTKSAMLGVAAAAPFEFVTADAPKDLVEELAGIAAAKGDGENISRFLVRLAALPDSAGATKQAVLAKLLRGLSPSFAPPPSPELEKALLALVSSADPQVSAAALPFATRWGKDPSMVRSAEPMAQKLLAAVADPKASDEVRVQNFNTLLAMASTRARGIDAAASLLVPASSTDLQRAVIEALGSSTDEAVAPTLVSVYPRLTGALRDLALSQIFKRPEWTLHLVGEIEAKRFGVPELGPGNVHRLRNHPDRAVAARATRVIDAITGAENKAKDEIIAQLTPAVTKPGDAARGKQLLADNCLKCHAYKGEGRNVSPDLTGMGVHGPAELLVHIIDPNRAVEANYVSYNIKTRSGEVHNGIIARETPEGIVLKNAEGDREIRRADIEIIKSTGFSLMPTGLESLGAEALRDILTYLCADVGAFRIVDIQTAATASTVRGLYDPRREPHNLKLAKFGIVTVEGIPFRVLDPDKSVNGNNAIVLKGGAVADWFCKVNMPRRVELPVGFAFSRLHVLGGIAAWGTLDPERPPEPAVTVTYQFADGKTEQKILNDAVEISDWVRRVDVPGSRFVEGLVKPGERGQLRWFTLQPRRSGVIDRIILESPDNYQAPTFLAFTAEVGEGRAPQSPPPKGGAVKTLIVGGGASHDFEKFWKGTDAATLGEGASYTSDPAAVAGLIPAADVLYLGNNQPLPEPARKGVFDHVGAGKGLLLVHASTWFNWKDWPEYNRTLVSGGSRGHEKLQEFEVTVTDAAHPVTAGVTKTFRVVDELYRFEKDAAGPEIKVLAVGKSLQTSKEYPVVWTVPHDKARIVCVTLGHDARAHEHEAYKKILQNSVEWAARKK